MELFRERIRGICGAFDVERDDHSGQIRAAARLERRGGLEIARIALSRAEVRRDRACLRRDPGDHFFLVIQQRGAARMAQGARARLLAPGDMILIDSARSSRFRYEADAVQLSLHLPRAELRARFGASAQGGLTIRRDAPFGLALRASLTRAGGAEAALDLLGALLREREAGEVSRGSALLGAALAEIALRYSDPGFGSAALAARVGLSQRGLQRAFRTMGVTPAAQVQALRLEAARERLRRGGAIAEAAFGSGFGDLSHFYRAYRRRFGETPGACSRLSHLSKTP